MGLLDELKKQAEAKQQAAASGQGAVGKNRYYDAVQSALKAGSVFFNELAESLNVIKPDVRRQFYVEGSSKLTNLVQGEYTPRDSRQIVAGVESLASVTLRFTLTGPDKLTFDKEARQANMMKEYLWAYSLPFEHRDVGDDNGRIARTIITVSSKVPSSVTLSGNADTGSMLLVLRNVELLGDVKQAIDVSYITPDFFDEVGKAVLAQPNRLREWGRPPDAPLPVSFAPPRNM